MGSIPPLAVELAVIGVLIVGIAQFSSVRTAKHGNWTAALAMVLAAALVLWRQPPGMWAFVAGAVALGGVAGLVVAAKVRLIQIPALVAFQHGAGGIAAFLVSFVELQRIALTGPSVERIAGLLGAFVGAATFSASLVASGKLAGKLRQQPTVLRRHNLVLCLLLLASAVAGTFVGAGGPEAAAGGGLLLIASASLLGWVLAIRVGGADMPVLISFLNATAGLAAAFCGVIIGSQLLVAFGATVAASGSVLTHVMCRAMNRSLFNVFKGLAPPRKPVGQGTDESLLAFVPVGTAESGPHAPAGEVLSGGPAAAEPEAMPAVDRAVAAMREAHSVIIVPGYGMALCQGQFRVVELARRLAARGADAKFAIHPVAGRMPGHMNVLLAEAEASYEDLIEMDDINPRFRDTDLVLIVGACDVVNPAATTTEDTPISGMPILHAHESRQVVVCNLDDRPGYSGVPNSLYERPGVILLFGDAGATLEALLEGIGNEGGPARMAHSNSSDSSLV